MNCPTMIFHLVLNYHFILSIYLFTKTFWFGCLVRITTNCWSSVSVWFPVCFSADWNSVPADCKEVSCRCEVLSELLMELVAGMLPAGDLLTADWLFIWLFVWLMFRLVFKLLFLECPEWTELVWIESRPELDRLVSNCVVSNSFSATVSNLPTSTGPLSNVRFGETTFHRVAILK